LRVDPTTAVAPSRVRSGSRNWLASGRRWYDYGWLQRLQLSLDSWRYRWNHWLRDYNRQSQQNLLQSLGIDKQKPARVAWLIAAAVLTSGLLGLVALGRTGQKQRRREAEKIYRRLEKQIGRLGLSRAKNEGPAAYLERVASRWPRVQAEARRLARVTAKDQSVQRLQRSADV